MSKGYCVRLVIVPLAKESPCAKPRAGGRMGPQEGMNNRMDGKRCGFIPASIYHILQSTLGTYLIPGYCCGTVTGMAGLLVFWRFRS